MQFRDRGQGIQIIRVTVDPETKKTKEAVLGSIPKRTLEVDPAILEKASPEEQGEIHLYVDRMHQIAAAKVQAEAYSLPETVRAAIRYLEVVTDPTERSLLQGMMLDASRRLRRAARAEAEEEAA